MSKDQTVSDLTPYEFGVVAYNTFSYFKPLEDFQFCVKYSGVN